MTEESRAEATNPAAPTREERIWASVSHAGTVLAYAILMPFAAPLVIYLAKSDESEFIADQARESLNFQLTVLFAAIATLPLWCIGLGELLAWAIGLYAVIISLVAAVKSYDGQRFRYPVNLRLVRGRGPA